MIETDGKGLPVGGVARAERQDIALWLQSHQCSEFRPDALLLKVIECDPVEKRLRLGSSVCTLVAIAALQGRFRAASIDRGTAAWLSRCNWCSKSGRKASRQEFGQIIATYFGGRAEVRIRREVRQVLLTDFKSMYPTLCTLMGIDRFIVAEATLVSWAFELSNALRHHALIAADDSTSRGQILSLSGASVFSVLGCRSLTAANPVLRSDGVCRLNPELARVVAAVATAAYQVRRL